MDHKEQEQVCKNCNHTFYGKFCNACGEKVIAQHDKRIVHLFEEGFHFITHFEGSFFTTVKTIFTKPGKFSLDYCNGIRKKYFKPVSLLLLFIVLYLLFPRFQGLNMKLNTYASKQYDFTWASIPLIKSKMKDKQIDYKQVSILYDSKSAAVSKISLFVIIPLAAFVLFALFLGTKNYFFDHTIMALELTSIYIGLHFLFIPFVSFIAEKINKSWSAFFYDDNYWLGYAIILIDLVIVTYAFKTFYQQKWIWSILKAAIYIVVFGEIIFYIYRLAVLFFTLLIC